MNRALADLVKLGAITVGRRHIEVMDVALLRAQIRY